MRLQPKLQTGKEALGEPVPQRLRVSIEPEEDSDN